MLDQSPESPRYNLEELAIAAALEKDAVPNLRTIRSWIKAGVMQGPDGRGQGKHYGEEHRERLLFLQRVQKQLKGARLPLKCIAAHLEYVDPAVIRRVALGTEELTIVGAEMLQDEWLTMAASEVAAEPASMSPASMSPAATSRVRGSDRDNEDASPWTTIDVTPEISLRLKGDDPEQVVRLAKMARHLREWTGEEF